jgi:hypothetical protein
MKKIICISVGLILLNSCILDKGELRNIEIINKSDDDIYCLISTSDSLNQYEGYNDYKIFRNSYRIKKDSIENVYHKPRDWNSYITNCEGGKMRLFIIAQDSIDKYGWKDIILKSINTKVYKLDINDLNKNSWQIIFDGI